MNDRDAKALMRQRWKHGKRTMTRDDWEIVVAQLLTIFNVILWSEVLIKLSKGFFS
jgi:hypothetical protein